MHTILLLNNLKKLKYFILQHHVDPAIGVYIIDRYTFYALKFLENVKLKSRISMKSFVSYLIFCTYYVVYLKHFIIFLLVHTAQNSIFYACMNIIYK